MFEKPFSQPCENNKGPILKVLRSAFAKVSNVLEIGSGTGQHAVYFAANMPHLQWQCADQVEYHDGINAWLSELPSPNLHAPLSLSLPTDPWPIAQHTTGEKFDAFFTANTAHIMLEHQLAFMMEMLNKHVPLNGIFCQYGPFKVNNKFSSESNQAFHEKLISSGRGGYRDLSELQAWAPNLDLHQVIEMPANNLMLIWRKNHATAFTAKA